MADLKKALINVDGFRIEMYILESSKDVNAFFKEFPIMEATGLKSKFKEYISEGQKVILDTTVNRAGFYSWRMVGDKNFNTVDSTPKPTDYYVTLREKYSRLEKTFRVSAIKDGNLMKADINETENSYRINGAYFLKIDLMEFSCSLVN